MKPLPATVRSASFAQQAVVSGWVLDSLTGEAPRSPMAVRLIDRDSGKDYPLLGTTGPDGSFAFFASPETAFPRLAVQTYRLQVEAGAARYIPATFDFDAGPVAGQPAAVSIPVPTPGIANIEVRLFNGGGLPQADISLSLDREPVRLAGRVVVSNDPTVGVDSATVQQNPPTGPSVVAGPDGAFEFAGFLPVVLSLQLRISAAGFETSTLTFEPDYTRPTNQVTVLLKRS